MTFSYAAGVSRLSRAAYARETPDTWRRPVVFPAVLRDFLMICHYFHPGNICDKRAEMRLFPCLLAFYHRSGGVGLHQWQHHDDYFGEDINRYPATVRSRRFLRAQAISSVEP
ncbi:hypothetical protein KCP70_02465 [Salmonella enterica subsp. enterica]|nr:hypothetical protein KCP70_02465 [Salmonella enterica subsp. enterica]